ncbi:hypothetical protein EYE40_05415 [Glaciihabitans arcticus]|uniref:Uncharacterized protein n=1 Tax=Glaciihabitans arcticus TaxID=2668039 RepID=A0A4Q9GRZ8_9MICO|nr:hypothetical protein [Glaciihabitans arcticus]TBN56884.1 hypothetical protein EYE40_05415 [Glaciihabitans arcticus]
MDVPAVTDDELDARLARPPLVDDGGEAQRLAHTVAAQGPRRVRRHRVKTAAIIALVAALAGGTAATAVPAAIDLLSEPELATERTFVVDGVPSRCSITVQVLRDPQSKRDDPTAEANLIAARIFLQDIDADALEPDLSALTPSDLAISEGQPEELRLIQSINAQVMAGFAEAKLLKYGVTVEGLFGCDEEPAE